MKRQADELLRGGCNGKVKVYNSTGELVCIEHSNGKVMKVVRRC